MPNWISITIATLYEAKIAALVDACDSAALAANQPNRSAGIIQGVVDDIRRKVASWQRNQVDTDLTTIPKGLRNLAMDLILARLKLALEFELTQDERDQLNRHERTLIRISEGREVVDQPDNAEIAPMEPVVPPPAFGNFPHRRNNTVDG